MRMRWHETTVSSTSSTLSVKVLTASSQGGVKSEETLTFEKHPRR